MRAAVLAALIDVCAVQAGLEAIPGPADMVMFGLYVLTPGESYVEGSYPACERYWEFVEWYTDPRPLTAGWLTRSRLLSNEMVAASLDSAVLRRFAAGGYLPLLPKDRECEPRIGKPFPGPGAATDRWFAFRDFYYSPGMLATRRLFLEQRAAEACVWLQSWAYATWDHLYR